MARGVGGVGAGVTWVGALVVLAAGVWIPAWSGDEAATAMVVRRPLAQVIATGAYDPALVPYYLLANAWAAVASGEGWLRLLSVLAMASAVLGTAMIASRFGGHRLGLLAAATMLALPAVSRYGQEARPYALSVLLVVGAVFCWSTGLRTWPRCVALGGIVAATGFAQPYALLIVPVLLVSSAIGPTENRSVDLVRTAAACAVGVGVAVPQLVAVADRAAGQPDPSPVTLSNLVEEALRLPTGVLSPPLAMTLAAVVLASATVGVTVAWRRGQHRFSVLLVSWIALPPLLLCGLQLFGIGPGLVARYWTFCLPALAIAAAVALDALWIRSRTSAVVVLAAVVVLGGPTQKAVRAVDGHLGQRWRDLPLALDHPAIEGAPLLVEGWSYRALVSNEPALALRMALVVDPAPTGRVNPLTHRAGSPVFARLLAEHGRVIVLQGERGYASAPPTRSSFSDFLPELAHYPVLAVRCTWFGEPLGVFTTATAALTPAEAEDLARHVVAVAPRRAECATGG